MLGQIVFVTLACLCVVYSYEITGLETMDEEPYVLIPLSRVRRQLSGFGQSFPNGGFRQTARLDNGPAWASVSQNFNNHGQSGPQTFAGGLNLHNPNSGSGFAFSGTKTPSFGSSVTAHGTMNLVNDNTHNANAWASHTQNFNKDGHRLGEVNSLGINYNHKDGAGAFASGTRIPGRPDSATVGGGVPLYNNGDTSLTVDGSRTWTKGFGHNDQVGLNFKKDF